MLPGPFLQTTQSNNLFFDSDSFSTPSSQSNITNRTHSTLLKHYFKFSLRIHKRWLSPTSLYTHFLPPPGQKDTTALPGHILEFHCHRQKSCTNLHASPVFFEWRERERKDKWELSERRLSFLLNVCPFVIFPDAFCLLY